MAIASGPNRVAEWFHQWRGPLLRFLSRRGIHRVADLDDIGQEVFLRLLRYESHEPVDHPQAYVFKIASNVAAEWAMRAHHRYEHSSDELDGLVDDTNPEEVFENASVQNQIQQAVTKLSGRQQQILKLYFEEGVSQRDIADRLSVTYRVVRRDFENAYVVLRRELKVKLTGVFADGSD